MSVVWDEVMDFNKRSLPEAHLLTPAAGELFKSQEAALLRLQNWAFTQGFAVITQSG